MCAANKAPKGVIFSVFFNMYFSVYIYKKKKEKKEK